MSFILALIIVGFIFFVIGTLWWYQSIPSNLPPGPLGLPFIGNALDTWRVRTWFSKLCQWSEEYGPVYRLYIGRQLVLVLGDYDAMNEAMVKHGDAYAGRPVFRLLLPEEVAGLGLVNSEGELWKVHRRFALSTLRDFGFGRPIIEPRIKDEVEYVLEAISETKGRPFDLTPLLGNAVSNVICSLVFSRRFQYDDARFHSLLRLIRTRVSETPFSFLTPMVLSKTFATFASFLPMVKKLQSESMKLISFIQEEIDGAMRNFQVDRDEPSNYIQAYYKAKNERSDDEMFFDQQLLASVANLFVAGTDTTATTLRWAIFFMAHNPEYQELVYQELIKENSGCSTFDYADRIKLPYTEAVIMETQRLANLLPVGLLRKTVIDTKLRGYHIPVGTVVAPVLGAAMIDSNIYPNQQIFDPTRFLGKAKDDPVFSHVVPFGLGKRSCLGESLAKMELFLFFTGLMSKYKFFFSPDQPKPPKTAPISLIRSPPAYKICAEPRLE